MFSKIQVSIEVCSIAGRQFVVCQNARMLSSSSELVGFQEKLEKKLLKTDINPSVKNELILKEVGNKGVITLNRPESLNALSESMADKLNNVLKKWEPSKKLVIVKSSKDKIFCAGGDIKQIFSHLKGAGDPKQVVRNIYTLCHTVHNYNIPYVAIMNGITMGGGAGISINGKYRIATEKTVFAMPEAAIGLSPDAGGTYFLPRLKGKLGLFLGLTGYRLKGIDVLLAGLATHYISSESMAIVIEELLSASSDNLEKVLKKYSIGNANEEFSLQPHLPLINECFSAPTVEDIIERLKEDNSEWALKMVKSLSKMCPTSLKVAKVAIETGSSKPLDECLRTEFRNTYRCLTDINTDFAEGVRALLVDKDNKPKWNPKNLIDVTDEHVRERLSDLPPSKELIF